MKVDLEKLKEDVALIDKCSLGGLRILDIEDMEKLTKQGIVEISTNEIRYRLPNGQEFNRMTIKDDVVNVLRAGTMENKQYCTMQTSIKGDYKNLCCYTVDDEIQLIDDISEHIKKTYGVIGDLSNPKLKLIEINKTFRLNGQFKEYSRVFNVMLANIPKSFRFNGIVSYKMDAGNGYTLVSYNGKETSRTNAKKLKVYSKSQELIATGKFIIDNEVVRFELTLIGTKKIKQELGTNMLKELTDEKINEWFNTTMLKMFVFPMKKWKTDRDKTIEDMICEEYSERKNRWQRNVLGRLKDEESETRLGHAVLLDVEELDRLIHKIFKGNRPDKKMNSIRKLAEEAYPSLLNRDDLKLDEVIKKLMNVRNVHTKSYVSGHVEKCEKPNK